MGHAMHGALVFRSSPSSPVRIVDTFNYCPPRSLEPAAVIARTKSGEHVATVTGGPHELWVNGKARRERVLRDGDELAVHGSVALFRSGFTAADLEPGLRWHVVRAGIGPAVPRDPARLFHHVFASFGHSLDLTAPRVIEDWRQLPLGDQYFGFGRTRTVAVNAAGVGADMSRWEVVRPEQIAAYRQRWTTVGLDGLTLRWQVTKRHCEENFGYDHDVLLIGGKDNLVLTKATDVLSDFFDAEIQCDPAPNDTLWDMHFVDRIVKMPNHAKHGSGNRVNSTITRA